MPTYTFQQLEDIWVKNGGKKSLAPVMAAIAKAESGGKSEALHVNSDGSTDRGLWQINSSNYQLYQGQNIFDPNANARVAIRLAEHSGNKLKNWTTYRTGAYRKYLPKMSKKTAKITPKNFGIYTGGNFAGVDQGVDFRGKGAIPALGSGVVTDVGHTSIIEGGKWSYLIYKLTSGPYKGQFVYVAENFVPTVKKGTKLALGQTIGRAIGTYPYTETGFNRTARGWNPSSPLSASNPHASTPAGNTMNQYISGVAGLKRGGSSFLHEAGTVVTDVGGAAQIFTNPSAAFGAAGSLFSSGASAAGNALGIHPEAWVQEAISKLLEALAIAGGGFVFVLGFTLVAADIGLSTRAGKVVAAVPAGKAIARAARPKTGGSSSARTAAPPRTEERREELHQARLKESAAREKRTNAAATESRTRQKNRRKTKKEQEAAETKAYYRGATDAASPRMAQIRKSKKRK